jgi:hypothetical protein
MRSEWILGRVAWGMWIGFDWLRTGTGGVLLWVWWWTFGFLRLGVSWLSYNADSIYSLQVYRIFVCILVYKQD